MVASHLVVTLLDGADYMLTSTEWLVWPELRAFCPDLRGQPAVLRAETGLRAVLRLAKSYGPRGPRYPYVHPPHVRVVAVYCGGVLLGDGRSLVLLCAVALPVLPGAVRATGLPRDGLVRAILAKAQRFAVLAVLRSQG